MLGLFGEAPVVELAVERAAYAPGDEVRGVVRVRCDEGREVRRGLVVLRCEESCEIRVRRRDSRGRSRTVTRSVTTPLHEEERTFMEAAALSAAHDGEYPFAFRLPEDRPPSYVGEIVEVRWRLEARLDLPGAPDATDDREIAVGLPPRGPFPAPRHGSETEEHGEAVLRLELAGEAVGPGQPLRGVLHAAPRESLAIEEIRVELERVESVPAEQGNEHTETAAAVRLTGELELSPGLPLALPFEAPLPAGGPPSLATPHAAAYWEVTGVLARSWRTDLRVRRGFHVYSLEAPDVR